MNLFTKNTPIKLNKRDTDINKILYKYFLSNRFITKEKLSELGVRDINRKVNHINDNKRFYLEEVGNEYNICFNEKLPRTDKEIEDYNIKLRPKNLRILTRKIHTS